MRLLERDDVRESLALDIIEFLHQKGAGVGHLMTLPPSNGYGDLPPGVYRVNIDVVVQRFGLGTEQRGLVSGRLLHILVLAQRTDHLLRLIVFGSYVTDKPAPNDVDVILVMDDEFRIERCPVEAKGLFDRNCSTTPP